MEELISLEKEGVKYAPDLVLLCWNETDYDDNVRSALYRLTPDGALVEANKAYLPGVDVQEKLNRIPGYGWMQANSDLYSFLRENVSYRIAKPLLLMLSQWSVGRPIGSQMSAKNDRQYPAMLTIALLHRIELVTEAHHARFLVFDIPGRNENSGFHSDFPHELSGSVGDLPLVSPVAAFSTRCADGLIYWKKSQGHFTPFWLRHCRQSDRQRDH